MRNGRPRKLDPHARAALSTLLARGQHIGVIASALGVHRNTVRNYRQGLPSWQIESAMAHAVFNDTFLANLPMAERGHQYIYWDRNTPTLGIRIGTRTKSFFVMFGQARRRITLGHYPEMPLAVARATARGLISDIKHARARYRPTLRDKALASVTPMSTTTPATFDATKGHYWIVQQSDQQWAVLWSHPSRGDWHKLIAVFADKARAEAYTINESQSLDPKFAAPDLVDAPPLDVNVELVRPRPAAPARSLRMYETEELGEKIMARLDELHKLYPTGISIQAIMAHFNVTYEQAGAALRWIGHTKRAQWVYRGGPGHQRKYLFPNNITLPRRELSILQEKVLAALVRASHNGTVSGMGYRDIARAADVNRNSVSMALDALRTKGYIRLVDKGHSKGANQAGGIPSSYEVSLTPDISKQQDAKDAKPPRITFDDLAKAGSKEEAAALERKMWEQMGIDPDKDLYPPEEAAARFDTMLRAAVGHPPKDEEDAERREQIRRDNGWSDPPTEL